MTRYVVIFKARVKRLDEEYGATATRMYNKAINEYGCVDFVAATEAGQEIALSYWNSLDDIARWKADPEHQLAQQLGAQRWYDSYTIEIAEIQRSYSRQNG